MLGKKSKTKEESMTGIPLIERPLDPLDGCER